MLEMKAILFLFIVGTVLDYTRGARRLPAHAPGHRYDLYECQTKICLYGYFNCDCEKPRQHYINSSVCIPSTWMCDGQADCEDGSDEKDCSCNENEMQCSICDHGSGCSGNLEHDLYHCSPQYKWQDGELDCLGVKDEFDSSSKKCPRCDGKIDCPYLEPHDEMGCEKCPSSSPNRCACNKIGDMTCEGDGLVCYSNISKCDGLIECTDASDEIGCSAGKDEFTCQCYKRNPPGCFGNLRFIPLSKYHDGNPDCYDGSDESQFMRHTQCNNCSTTIFRLNSVSECKTIGLPNCDTTTCYETSDVVCSSRECNETQVICTSFCPGRDNVLCNKGFQCADGSLALALQFCDGNFDCPDNSDELTNHPGFKCVEPARTCVLPQQNLKDSVPHCSDESDFCTSANRSCFQCFDKRLMISSKQVCDGVIDCFDLSDECLCENSGNNPLCANLFSSSSGSKCGPTNFLEEVNTIYPANAPQHLKRDAVHQVVCQAKWGKVYATLCDGRPECNDLSDECNCENPPSFCNDTCHLFYRLGDRYCNGVEDDAWKFINDSSCPKGFDELSCPKRHVCTAGTRMSIDVMQICNGVQDCDDGSDEGNCSVHSIKTLFSSDSKMIQSVTALCFFWLLGIAALCGNFYVIVVIAYSLKQKLMKTPARVQYMILLNIFIADLIMGIYLFTIAVESVRYAGRYSEFDYQWRSSTSCSVIGALAFLSTEASTFFMVLLVSFFLFRVTKKRSSVKIDRVWKILIGVLWFVSILLATAPMMSGISQSFVEYIWMPTPFSQRVLWDVESAQNFACSLATISGRQIANKDWLYFLENHAMDYTPLGVFGYYGETSVCLPNFFDPQGGTSWRYAVAMIVMNFALFLFIAVGYVAVYFISIKNENDDNTDLKFAQHEATVKRRVTRMVCASIISWTVLGVLAIVSADNTRLSDEVFVISASLLFPITSVLNPFLYSPLPERIAKILSCKKMDNVRLY